MSTDPLDDPIVPLGIAEFLIGLNRLGMAGARALEIEAAHLREMDARGGPRDISGASPLIVQTHADALGLPLTASRTSFPLGTYPTIASASPDPVYVIRDPEPHDPVGSEHETLPIRLIALHDAERGDLVTLGSVAEQIVRGAFFTTASAFGEVQDASGDGTVYRRQAHIEFTPTGIEITPTDGDPGALPEIEMVRTGPGRYELKMHWAGLSDAEYDRINAQAQQWRSREANIRINGAISACSVVGAMNSTVSVIGESSPNTPSILSGSNDRVEPDGAPSGFAWVHDRTTEREADSISDHTVDPVAYARAVSDIERITAEYRQITGRILGPYMAAARAAGSEPRPARVVQAGVKVDDGAWTTITEHQIEYPRTGARRAALLSHNRSSVVIVAETEGGGLLVVRQWKNPIGRITVEFPAGYLETEREDPVIAAMRELREETGYTSDTWHYLGSFYREPGRGRTVLHVCLARFCRKGDGPALDDTEELQADVTTESEVEAMMRDGRMPGLHCLGAWAIARPYVLGDISL